MKCAISCGIKSLITVFVASSALVDAKKSTAPSASLLTVSRFADCTFPVACFFGRTFSLLFSDFVVVVLNVSEFKIRTNEYGPLCEKSTLHARYELVADKLEKFIWRVQLIQ